MRKLAFFLLWMTMELSTGADEYCKNYSIEDCADDLVKSYCPFCDSIPTQTELFCGSRDIEGICVPFYQCDADRIIESAHEGYRQRRFSDTCGATEVCCSPPIDASSKPSESFSNCGEASPIFKLVVEEGEAYSGEFPWMLYIYTMHTKTRKRIYLCGGSLIHPKVALTAAHTVSRIIGVANKELFVRGRETVVDDPVAYLPSVNIKVSKIIIHEDFNSSGLFYDVALLILEKPFKNAPHISTICLPPPGEIIPQKNCISTGWGKSAERKDGDYQNALKKIELPIVPHADCNNALKKTRLKSTFILHESFMCAGGIEGRDTCKGDGGSPLICPFPNNPKRFMQVGIVAWGIDCGENNIPGVYANVPYLRGWIDKQLKSNQIEISEDP